MNLSSILEKIYPAKKEQEEYFLALEFRSQDVKAAIWQKENEKITLINIGSSPHKGDWEDVVKAADAAIVEASGNIAQEKIEKVIFGISESWTKENKILNLHLANLKKLCLQLALKPLGFVVVSEAIVNYLKQIEGIPPTALLIGPEEDFFTLTLAKVGRIEGTKIVNKEEGKTLPEQIEETLESFSVEILPSRILLYDGKKDLEKTREDLLAHRFSDKLPFLHLPKIEIMDRDFDIKALALTSGIQMGGVVITQEEISAEKKPEEPGETEGAEKTTEEGDLRPPGLSTDDNLGFVKDKDILEETGVAVEEEEIKQEEARQEETQFIEEEEDAKPRIKLPSLKFPRLNFPMLKGLKWAVIILVLLLGVGGGALFAAWWYLPKAEVKIWVQAKSSEKDAQISLSGNTEKSNDNLVQASSRMVEIEEKSSKKISTTGKKTVGDPAKGTLVIYNKTENEKRFSSGAVLVGSNGLKFTLDDNLVVASTAAFSTTISSTNGKITAVKIGSEGNLSGGTNLSFEDYPTSSYFAKTIDGLSGGTSKEVSVVAKADQESLLASLSDELTSKAKDELQGKLNADEKLVEQTIKSKVLDKKFDKEVGAETSELSLTLTAGFNALTYNEKDLKDGFLKTMKDTIPQGYDLIKDGTAITILGVETKNDTTTLKINAKINLSPKLNTEEFKKNILGKTQSSAEEYLRKQSGIDHVEINLTSPFPLRLRTLPHLPQNIKIEVAAN